MNYSRRAFTHFRGQEQQESFFFYNEGSRAGRWRKNVGIVYTGSASEGGGINGIVNAVFEMHQECIMCDYSTCQPLINLRQKYFRKEVGVLTSVSASNSFHLLPS
jgi:hypothetical protein